MNDRYPGYPDNSTYRAETPTIMPWPTNMENYPAPPQGQQLQNVPSLTPAQFMAQAVQDYKLCKDFSKMMIETADMTWIAEKNYDLGQWRMQVPVVGPTDCFDFKLPFPLPADLFQWINGLSQASGWRFDSLILPTLGAVTAAMRGRMEVQLDPTWKEPLALYLLEVAPSGSKKSMIVGALKQPFSTFERSIQGEYQDIINAHNRHAQNLIAIEKKHTQDEIKKIVANNGMNIDAMIRDVNKLNQRLSLFDKGDQVNVYLVRLTAEHISSKKLAQIMQQNGDSVFLIGAEDEILQRLSYDKRVDLSLYLKGHTGEEYIYETLQQQAIRLQHPIINIMYLVQPEIINSLYRSGRLQNLGLSPRFLVYFTPPEYMLTSVDYMHKKIDGDDLYGQKIFNMLTRYYTQDPQREVFNIFPSSTAYQAIKKFEYDCRIKIANCKSQEGLCSFISKLHGSAVRLAGAIHCWRHDKPEEHELDYQDMANGIAIAKILLSHADYAFSENGIKAYQAARKVWRWLWNCDQAKIVRNGMFVFALRDVQRGATGLKKDDLLPAFEMLEQCNILRKYIRPGLEPIYILHPAFFYSGLPQEI